MMSTISPFRPRLSTGIAARSALDNPPSPGPAPAPTPAPTPTPAPDPGLDFSNIDGEKKAALLPALNSATLMVLLQAMGNAAQGGMALTSALAMTFNSNTQASASYSMADPSSLSMTGAGTFGSAAFNETWTIDPATGSLLIKGTIGNSDEQLAITAAQDGNHIDGTIGSVAVHELVTSQGDGNDAKLVFDGTINGVATHQELSASQADPNAPASLHAQGTLGSDPIQLDETVSAQDATSINLAATGNIAGTALTMTQSIQVSEPAPPPAPNPAPAPNPPAPPPAPTPAPPSR